MRGSAVKGGAGCCVTQVRVFDSNFAQANLAFHHFGVSELVLKSSGKDEILLSDYPSQVIVWIC